MSSRDVAHYLETFLDAWNSGEPERVAAIYTENLDYIDPNTRGRIRGRASFLRYLARLLSSWKMTWSAKEVYPLVDTDGWAVLWRAVIRTPDGGAEITLDGMDLIVMEGDKIARNEVYFDRSLLAPLMEGRT
jgi:ketosteroid isomerase-like protein